MRFLWVYLSVYFAVVLGAFAALWIGGVFTFLSTLSILLGLIVACGLGALLALVWRWRPNSV
jgi:hypothetical protein